MHDDYTSFFKNWHSAGVIFYKAESFLILVIPAPKNALCKAPLKFQKTDGTAVNITLLSAWHGFEAIEMSVPVASCSGKNLLCNLQSKFAKNKQAFTSKIRHLGKIAKCQVKKKLEM